MTRWPKDNQIALIKFYGDPGTSEVAHQLVKVTPPFKMYYDGKLLNTLSFHKKAAPALLAALNKVWDYYGRNQTTINKLGMSKTAGTYNPRKVRGSATKWSNHAYGAAIDINAEQNGFHVVGNIPLVMIAAFKSEGARWGGDYKGRKDPMHFEFCESGEPKRSFEEWLVALGVKEKPTTTKVKTVSVSVAAEMPLMDFASEMPKPVVTPKPASAVLVADQIERGDPEIFSIQSRLKAMMYNPGGLDGVWGGMTAGAISGFINDRHISLNSPTSADEFNDIKDELKAALAVAESARFTRPIAPERALATPEELAPKMQEVEASIKVERLGFWGSIAAGFSATLTGIAKFFQDATEWLSPIKDFVGDLPWPVWVGGALMLSGALYYISVKGGQAKNAATQAYQEGTRT